MPLPTNEEFDAARERMREVFAEPIAELKDLLELIDGGLNRPETKPTYTDLEEAVVGHWGRAVAVTIGVLHLCEHSYGDLALTLNRSRRVSNP